MQSELHFAVSTWTFALNISLNMISVYIPTTLHCTWRKELLLVELILAIYRTPNLKFGPCTIHSSRTFSRTYTVMNLQYVMLYFVFNLEKHLKQYNGH